MNKEHQHDELIDLGAATTETKGPTAGVDDSHTGQIPFAGLSNE